MISSTPTTTFARPTVSSLSPTVSSESNVQLLQQPTPLCSTNPPNRVVIQLTTALVIPDYNRFYDTPIQSFRPSYRALDDGSLVASPFAADIASSNMTLLLLGVLTTLFIRNLLVSGDYLRRGKVKKKSLFYVLFISQILAPICFIPILVGFFNPHLNCNAVVLVATISVTISLALLMTGILGVKAYRCLDNSRFVLVMLVLFRCASTAMAVLDMQVIRGIRMLSGRCARTGDSHFIRIFVMIQLAESLFICGCFSYAVWSSRGRPATRGRISIQLSLEDVPDQDPNAENAPARRGWWDYVPKSEQSEEAPLDKEQPSHSLKGLFRGLYNKVTTLFHKSDHRQSTVYLRKPSLPGEYPLPQPPRPPTIRISNPDRPPNNKDQSLVRRRRTSPAPSSFSRISRLIPRMVLFREVMRDELCYTTFITANLVVVAVLSVIRISMPEEDGLRVIGWIFINWAVISVLNIHSFGRVVRRHEREAILQHPSAWDPDALRAGRPRQPRSLAHSIVSHGHMRSMTSSTMRDEHGDPFSDSRRIHRSSQRSWDSSASSCSNSDSHSPAPTMESFTGIREIPRNTSDTNILPSPLIEEFPSSGHNSLLHTQ